MKKKIMMSILSFLMLFTPLTSVLAVTDIFQGDFSHIHRQNVARLQAPQTTTVPANDSQSIGNQDLVNINNGSAQFQLPVIVPPGVNGFSPKLALNYSSQLVNVNGVFGFGWELGIPHISRMNKAGIPAMYEQDPVYQISSDYANGELIQTSTNTFQLRKEGAFVNITKNGNTWEMTTNDGMSYLFDELLTNNDQSKIYAWYVSKITDRNGNEINYTYDRVDTTLYPEKISYGPFEIKFVRESRDDKRYSFQTGFQVTYEERIQAIDVYSQGIKRFSHKLNYQTNDLNSRSDLASYTMTGYDTQGGSVTQTTTFDYYQSGAQVNYLKAIHLHTGGSFALKYFPSTKLFNASGTQANKNLYFPMQVVTEVTRSDFTGRNDLTTYTYSGGKMYFESAQERQMAGFKTVEIINPLGQKSVHNFHQDPWAFIGAPESVKTYGTGGNLLTQKFFLWDKADLGNNRVFPFQTRMVQTAYVGGEAVSTAVEQIYDTQNGNLTEVINYGEVQDLSNGDFTDVGSDLERTNIAYTLPLTAFDSTTSVFNQNNDLISENRKYYDNLPLGQAQTGNLTKASTVFIDENRELSDLMAYDSYGNIIEITDALGNTTTLSYDTNHLQPTTLTNALGHVLHFEHDVFFGKATKITDPNGLVSQTNYDGFGREVRSIVDATVLQEMTYLESSYPHGVKTSSPALGDSYAYMDGFGNVLQTKTAHQQGFVVSNTVYDELLRPIKQTLPITVGSSGYNLSQGSGLSTTTTYDDLGNPIQVTDANGTTNYLYAGRKQTIFDPAGNKKTFIYDAQKNLVEVQEFLNGQTLSTHYEYNDLNLLTKLTDANSNTRNFAYDSLGRITYSEDLNNYGSWTYTYDDLNQVISATDPKGTTFNYTYDALGRKIVDDNATYVFDERTNGLGQLTSVNSPNYNWSATYDIRGRMIQESVTVEQESFVKSYAYNTLNQLTAVSYSNPAVELAYSYDAVGNITAISSPDLGGIIDDVSYEALGQIKQIDYANGVVSKMQYDKNQMYRMSTKQTLSPTSTYYQNLTYRYDVVGNITQLRETANTAAQKKAQYTYDELYRLTEARVGGTQNGSNYSRTYSFDAIGNITHKSDQGDYYYSSNHPQAVTEIEGANGAKRFSYDANGNMISESFQGQYTKTFVWDNHNRLNEASVIYKNGNEAEMEFGYEPGGRRVKKYHIADPIVDIESEEEIESEGGASIAGVSSAAVPTSVEKLTLYPFADVEIEHDLQAESDTKKVSIRIGNTHVATIENNKIYFHHDDHLGGGNIVTDEYGALVQAISYYPFGSVHDEEQTTDYDSTQKFTGYELDDFSDLYYAQARYYNAEIGKFISEDPLGWRTKELLERFQQTPQAFNMYSYTVNNPLRFVDPTGEFTWDEWKLAFRHPFKALKARKMSKIAIDRAKELFDSSELHNGKGDAFRHAFWNALMTVEIGEDFAKKFADAHESDDNLPNDEVQMDLFNNQIGREIGRDFINRDESIDQLVIEISDKVIEALNSGKLQTELNKNED